MKKEKEQNYSNPELENTIDPEEIVLDDDSDMPEPETKSYQKTLKCSDKFMALFNETINKLPYATILKNANNDSIKLIDLVKYVEARKDSMPVDEMDKVVSFIANIEFKYARSLMELIENQQLQKTLWTLNS